MLAIFDAHADTLSRLHRLNQPHLHGNAQINLSRPVPNHAQCFAIWRYDYDTLHNLYRALLADNPDAMAHCTTADDIAAAWQQHKLAALLTIEGADVIDCDIRRLERIASDGVRLLAPVWNNANVLCGSCRELPEQGLTQRGEAFVREAWQQGIAIDLSHAGDAAIDDILTLAERLGGIVLASHSNARALCDNARNLADEQFTRIAALNGVVGLNLYTYFVNGQPQAAWQQAADHLDHWLSLGGQNAIALGGDWDGCDLDGELYIVGNAQGVDDYRHLYDILTKRGWTTLQLQKLFYTNMIRVVTSCTTVAHATIAST